MTCYLCEKEGDMLVTSVNVYFPNELQAFCVDCMGKIDIHPKMFADGYLRSDQELKVPRKSGEIEDGWYLTRGTFDEYIFTHINDDETEVRSVRKVILKKKNSENGIKMPLKKIIELNSNRMDPILLEKWNSDNSEDIASQEG
jgi:hypothetical protein